MKDLTKRVGALSPKQRSLLELQLKRRGRSISKPPIVARPRTSNLFPLSFAQQGLWFLDQIEPENPSYNLTDVVHLAQRLDVDALERSFNAIVRRHESLRTTFTIVEDRPAQVIAPELTIRLPIVDLQDRPAASREAAGLDYAYAEARKPFDLARGPLVRTTLLRLGPEEHLLLVTMHHIVSDHWSTIVLVRELAALYTAFSSAAAENPPFSLPELPIQYADYAIWQREWLQGAVLEQQTAYWRRQLADLPTLQLPTDRPRSAAQMHAGARETALLDRPLVEALTQLGQREGATLFMLLLAAFQTLFYRYTWQTDIVVGTDVANRTHRQIENLIGFFVNQLVLRTDLSGAPTFRELLGRVRDVTLNAYAHQDVPFEKLVALLDPHRDLSRSPLFQAKIVLLNAAVPRLKLPKLTLRQLDVHNRTAKFDITLFLWETDEGLISSAEYSVALFDAVTIRRMLEHFATLLRSIVAQPDARIIRLEMLTDAERRQPVMKDRAPAPPQRNQFKKVKPKAVSLSQQELVTMGYLLPNDPRLRLVQPIAPDVDLALWAQDNQALIESELLKHGAILFRNFNITAPAELERFAASLCPELFEENSEHTPVDGSVQTPVFYPPTKQLLWHNENSFNATWPIKIWFCCAKPAEQGGETPIVDSRQVFQRLDPALVERFARKNVMYIRNYGDGLGLNWQTVFRTTSRAAVEQQCRQARMECVWKSEDRLRTSCVRPPFIRHPKTGERSWFNQAQHWHTACLDRETRESLSSIFAEEQLPRDCRYGDGSRIEDSVMEEILGVYRDLELAFPWQRGDVLMLDNVLMAHGRNPFVGERKILVAMGEIGAYPSSEPT